MNRVGMLREVMYNTLEWCDTSHEHETLRANWLVLCFEDAGYVRVFCLDDGRVWHLTRTWFDDMTRELR